MAEKKLFLWVEGEDDGRFFERIIEPMLGMKYSCVEILRYARMPKKKIDDFLRSIIAMAADYIFVADINNSHCVTEKIGKIKSRYKNIDEERILVVIKEIEGWYLAGLDNDKAKKLKIHTNDCTDTLTKEQFNIRIPKTVDSRIDFMIEILNAFSVETAKEKNSSFRYFFDRFLDEVSEKNGRGSKPWDN